MDKRFTAIRILATLYRVLAWIALTLGLLAAVLALVLGLILRWPWGSIEWGGGGGGELLAVLAFLVLLVVSVLLFLLLYAAGEFLQVLLSVEENTRRTAYLAQQQWTEAQAAFPPVAPRDDYEMQP